MKSYRTLCELLIPQTAITSMPTLVTSILEILITLLDAIIMFIYTAFDRLDREILYRISKSDIHSGFGTGIPFYVLISPSNLNKFTCFPHPQENSVTIMKS